MIFDPMKKHRNVHYRTWGLWLLVLCLSLPTIVFAESEGLDALKVTKTDMQYAVDFSYLQTVAPNSIAWLYQPKTTINQPVMFCDNPDYYLRRQFNDHRSSNGSIFMTGEGVPDFSDPLITLYGRNCLDYSLFGSLSYYQEDAYYQENPILHLITPQGDYQLDVFAGIRTKLDDWDVSQIPATSLLTDALPGLLERSFIKPNPSSLPVEGDAWAILSTEPYEAYGNRYVIYARKRPIDYQTSEIAYVNQLEMDSRITLNDFVSVDNVGSWMLYAQNDLLWKKLTFEIQTSSRRRPFVDGGCGPTAVAMAIANLVEKEELTKLSAFASSPLGYRFCSCSINDYWCSGKHLTYQLNTADEYFRYLPIVVANFATGNNIWGIQGRVDGYGTSMRYLEDLCSIFDISVTQTAHVSDALTFLQSENTIAVACTSGYSSPFTKASHFLVLAGVDDEYLYVLDPMRRETYEALDRNSYLEIIVPGLVRIKLKDTTQCNLYPIYQLQKNSAS
ncbi:MAG: class B sortase [Clostridiales bacterium]|nr:class B sortase [Clostridiales bacterium]